MIDIHAHILPGVDDGAVDLAESLEMARQAVAGGTTELICTSHSAEWFEIGPLAVMQQQVATLQSAITAAGIPLKLWPGMEIFLTPHTPQHLAQGRAWTLAGSRYWRISRTSSRAGSSLSFFPLSITYSKVMRRALFAPG